MNLTLKAELIRRYGSQVEAAKSLKISESRLSYLVRGHITASPRVRAKLAKAFGVALAGELLATHRGDGHG